MRREMLMRAWGWKVGAAFMAVPPVSAKARRRLLSTRADISFLPPCRAIMTEKVRPLRLWALSKTASAICRW